MKELKRLLSRACITLDGIHLRIPAQSVITLTDTLVAAEEAAATIERLTKEVALATTQTTGLCKSLGVEPQVHTSERISRTSPH